MLFVVYYFKTYPPWGDMFLRRNSSLIHWIFGSNLNENKKDCHMLCHNGGGPVRREYSPEQTVFAAVQPTMMAAFLYLGAGAGLFLCGILSRENEKSKPLTKAELPYTLGMIVRDIAAPILLMMGLERTNSANASLLNNFEVVATSLIAFFVFKEALSRQLAIAIGLVTAASAALSFEGAGSFQFNTGSLLVLGAACCWGLENNCTRMLSSKSSVQITTIKGFFSGLGSLAVALTVGEEIPGISWILLVSLLGFVAYGLSIIFIFRRKRNWGRRKPAPTIP